MCGHSALYGLVAEPVRDTGVLDRAAAVLAASPGRPGLAEAKRRLTEGLPLIVGLSRADTEALQGRLVDLGLIPRIGPAPPGTAPLSNSSSTGILWPAVLIASLVGAGSVFWFVAGPGSSPPVASSTPSSEAPPAVGASASPTPSPTPEPAFPLMLGVQVQRDGEGRLLLVGVAQVRTADTPPSGDLSVVVRVPSGTTVLNEYVPESQARTHTRTTEGTTIVTKSLAFRLPLDEARFAESREAVVEASWGQWTSVPVAVALPPTR